LPQGFIVAIELFEKKGPPKAWRGQAEEHFHMQYGSHSLQLQTMTDSLFTYHSCKKDAVWRLPAVRAAGPRADM